MTGTELLWSLIVLLLAYFWFTFTKVYFLRITKWNLEIINSTLPYPTLNSNLCFPKTATLTTLHLTFPNTELPLFVLVCCHSQAHYKSENSSKELIYHFMGFSTLWNIFLLKSCQPWKLSEVFKLTVLVLCPTFLVVIGKKACS